MNNKKLITIALTTAFAVGITAPVFADTTAAVAVQDTAAVVTEAQQVMALATTVGVVQEINEDSKSPSILVKNDQTEIDFYINMDKASGNATWVIDENGTAYCVERFKRERSSGISQSGDDHESAGKMQCHSSDGKR